MNIGDIIKSERKKRNLSQKELAKRINKSERMLQKYESGEVVPSLEVLEKISTTLGVFIFSFLPSGNSLSNELIDVIAKLDIIDSKNANTDFLQKLSSYLEFDYNKLSEIVDDPLADLPLAKQLKLLTYLSELDYSAFLNFCESSKSYAYPKEIKEKIEEIMFNKLSKVEDNSFITFKQYLLTSFGNDIKDLKDDDLKDIQDEVNKFLEFALYKLQKLTYGEESMDEDN